MEKIVFDKDIVNNQLTVLNNSLVQQRDSKKTLLSYLEKFSNAMYEDFNSKDTEILLSLLNEAHYVFECIKLNINKILELKNFLENISKTDFLDSINAEKFNQDFTLLFEDISKTNSSYLMFMNNYKKTINTFKEENVLDFETPLSSDTLETSNFEDSQEIEEKTEEIINNNNNNIETFAENSIEEINSENNIESDTQTLVEKSTSKNEIENVVKKSTEEPSIIDYIEEDYNFIVPLKNKNIEKSNELISKIDTIIEEGEFKDNITQLVNNLAEEEVLKNNVLQVVDTLAEEESLKNNSEQFIESSNKELSSDNNIETNVEISNEELSSDNNIETNAEISNEELSSNNETNSKNESRNFELVEKTLLICKDEGIAVLPYSVTDLEEFFSNNPEKYSSIQDIIDQEYTISLKDFENTAFTRYKEAYKLAKNKSNLSLPQTVSYAKKMILISELSPIIIASCADVNELDYYLECLDNNNLDKFEAFKIIKK